MDATPHLVIVIGGNVVVTLSKYPGGVSQNGTLVVCKSFCTDKWVFVRNSSGVFFFFELLPLPLSVLMQVFGMSGVHAPRVQVRANG